MANFNIKGRPNGREPVLIHPDDASERDILNGGIVEMFNERGACLAGARVTKIAKGNIFVYWPGMIQTLMPSKIGTDTAIQMF